MTDFAAIDFETANNERTSVCSVGVVIVRDGEIVDNFYSLIQPEPNYYNYWCTQVHGLTRRDTEEAPVFPKVWKQIEPLIEGLPLVAHNKAFDESCLKAVFRCYQMDYPDYEFHCTCVASRKAFPQAENHQLHTISKLCGYTLDLGYVILLRHFCVIRFIGSVYVHPVKYFLLRKLEVIK